MALASAVIEHLHNVNQPRALFATHYHELTALRDNLPALYCATMKIREWQGDIIFMHAVIPGVADRSYGIHVAKLAGLPAPVIARAETLLQALEQQHTPPAFADAMATPVVLAASPPSPTLGKLSQINPDELSPKQALEALFALKALLESDG